ncbi:unnamed protein product, partial [Pylaiella littoralis]
HTSARGPRAEAKPLGSPGHCTSGASSPRFSDGRFATYTMDRSSLRIPGATFALLLGAASGQWAEKSVARHPSSLERSTRELQIAYPLCDQSIVQYIGDGLCDQEFGLNVEACNFDEGDCCECDCESEDNWCGRFDYLCVDPDSTCTDSLSFSFSGDDDFISEDDDLPTTDDSLSLTFFEDDDTVPTTDDSFSL